MAQASQQIAVGRRAARDGAPAVELTVGPVIAAFELPGGQACRLEDGVPRVVAIPVVGGDALLVHHAAVQRRPRIRRENVKRGGLDAVLDRPFHRPPEHRPVVGVHAEDEAAVDHHAEVVQAADRGSVVAPHVLILVLFSEVGRVQRLEADEQAAQSGFDRTLEQIGSEHRVDRTGRLPQAAHAAHPFEQRRGEAAIAEQVIVEEVEMASRQAVDLGKGRVDRLRVEGTPALEERLLVAEVADVRAAARDDDRVRDEVEMTLDQIPADAR